MRYLVLLLSLLATPAMTVEPIRIEIGSNYEKYSNEELRRRVFQLERAVAQLQEQVFRLALNQGNSNHPTNNAIWTCQIQNFGKTHIATGNTKASALAQALKKCGDASNPIHCRESDVKCGNE